MKKLIYILLAVTVTSCYEDIGNYKYNNIEDITIENIPTSLGDLIILEDTIKISPVVGPELEFKNDEYNYYWSIKEGSGDSAKLVRFLNEKDLVLPVTMAGSFTLRFEVESKKTGIINAVYIGGRGTSKMANGMYLLKETSDGKTNIDMIGFNTLTGEATTYTNLISILNNGQGLTGKPVTLDYWGYRKEDFANAILVPVPSLKVVSNQDIMEIDLNDFEVLARFDDLFLGDVPAVRNIQNMKSIAKHTILVNDNKLYSHANYSSSISGGVTREDGGNKFLPALTGNYLMDPSIAWAPNDGGNNFLTFDTVSGLFRYVTSTASAPRAIVEPSGKNEFKTDMQSNLLFVESNGGVFATSTYALFKGINNPEQLTLLDMKAGGLNAGTLTLSTNGRIFLNASDYKIDDASLWCVHQHNKNIYFVIGNQLWRFDAGSKTETLIKTYEGEEITYINCMDEYYTEDGGSFTKTVYTKFIVGTSAGTEYNLYKYEIGNGATPAAEPYFTAKGTGRIKDYLYIKPATTPRWLHAK
jgi:hypothetical protein